MRKVSGLIGKKPQMARAAWRAGFTAHSRCSHEVSLAVRRWHRAASGQVRR